MKTSEVRGIVLKQFTLFEKDKCIELLSEEHGKVKLLAKYAHGSQRFGARLEPSNIVSCQVYKGRSFDTVTHCDLIQHFPSLRLTLNSISLCLYCIDIIRKVTPFNHPNPELYAVLQTTLTLLNQNPKETNDIQHYFQTTLLHVEGLSDRDNTHHTPEQFKRLIESYSEKRVSLNHSGKV